MANSPAFAATPRSAFANISTAVTGRTVSGITGLTSLLVAGSLGSKIDQIIIKATSTTTVGCIRIWLYSGSGNAALIDEISVSAVTPAATGPAFQVSKSYSNFQIPSGYTVYVTTHKAESFNVIAFGGDF